MAILSSLLSVSEPKGFWITIIKAFEAVTNNYVLAIIFLTVVIRLIWGLVDTGTKYNQQRMNAMQSKMQPELEKIKTKYANQPQILQQKQNEVYKKHYGKSYYGSCFVMMLVMVLNMVIFFTLFAGLNTMSSYKNSVSYDSIKYTYANCLEVTDAYLNDENEAKYGTYEERVEYFADYQNLSFVFYEEEQINLETSKPEKIKAVKLVYRAGTDEEEILYTQNYKKDFSFKTEIPAEDPEAEPTYEKTTTNEYLISLIQKYVKPVYEEGEEKGSKEIKIWTLNEGTEEESQLYFSTAFQKVAMKNVVEVYDETKESFLWIDNIWIADSPLNKSIVSYKSLESQIGKKNLEKGEEKIYNAFMPELKEARSKTNGYFIIPLLCVATSILSMYLTNLYNKRKNAKKGLPPVQQNAKWTKIILPLILGLFALFYNSVFAIYMLVGQIVSAALLIPQLMIVDYFIDKKNKKDEDKNTVTVDYSRKF